ncbi:MAG: hypothetical protein A2X36_09960 [Elusimicrobia bacterium GWA2_69_24]|nr:MAG: hypothetical protein A2X36_09960 [Elusimicrobia bacterium GWA2_69_24]HBL17575.1 hypothetical protein [Elusimicrobiota bacterium]
MRFSVLFTREASGQLDRLETTPASAKRLKAVRKTLGLMETNLRHPSLNTHKFSSLNGPNGEEVFESYAENKTPAAFRVFWHYGPSQGKITIIAITPHP